MKVNWTRSLPKKTCKKVEPIVACGEIAKLRCVTPRSNWLMGYNLELSSSTLGFLSKTPGTQKSATDSILLSASSLEPSSRTKPDNIAAGLDGTLPIPPSKKARVSRGSDVAAECQVASSVPNSRIKPRKVPYKKVRRRRLLFQKYRRRRRSPRERSFGVR